MNDPGVTAGGPSGRRLASGLQGGAAGRAARPACAASRALAAGPEAADVSGPGRAGQPSSVAVTAATVTAAAVTAATPPRPGRRRLTGTPRAGGRSPTRSRPP